MDDDGLDTVLGRVRVRVRGTGEPMLFWPSLLMTGNMWDAQARRFGEDRRVILVDPPGHGRSQKLTAPFSFDDCARCIVDILDGLGIERAHFIGNSWGGMIGGTFAATHPDRIGRAVLMNCTASAAGSRQKIEYGFLLQVARLLGGIRPPLTRSVLKAFLGPTTFRTRPDVVAFVRESVQAVDVGSTAWAVRSVVPGRPDQRALFGRVTTPVLVVAGVEDATFPLTETIAMAEAIPGAAIAVLEGVAHLAALENPSLVNTLIEEFVFPGSVESMTQAPTLPPLHMRRNAFDPTPELRDIRETSGVRTVVNAFGMQVYLITRHEDVKEVLSDHERFRNSRPPGFVLPGAPAVSDDEQAAARAGNLLGLDPPDHQRVRRMLTGEFTVRRMKRLEPRIVEIVERQLDEMESAGPPADLVEHFALPIPSLVICELLGVPYADRQAFQRRSARQLDLSAPIPERLEMQRQGRDYMRTLVEAARRDPGEDMLGMLVREHGGELTDGELIGIAGLLLLAGHETTSNMLGLGTLALLRHPDQLAAVRDDPDAVGPAVEELLRWLSIVHTTVPRITATDVDVAGVTIPAGQLVFASLPSGNRDPNFIAEPDTLDIRRGAPGHLAFGHGVHHCLGAPLARMEMRIAFPALLRRFPKLALAEPFSDVQFRSFHFIYGLRTLEVGW